MRLIHFNENDSSNSVLLNTNNFMSMLSSKPDKVISTSNKQQNNSSLTNTDELNKELNKFLNFAQISCQQLMADQLLFSGEEQDHLLEKFFQAQIF